MEEAVDEALGAVDFVANVGEKVAAILQRHFFV